MQVTVAAGKMPDGLVQYYVESPESIGGTSYLLIITSLYRVNVINVKKQDIDWFVRMSISASSCEKIAPALQSAPFCRQVRSSAFR